MFKVGDNTQLNKQHKGFIGYETIWLITEINSTHYTIKHPKTKNEIQLTKKYVDKNHIKK